MGNTGHGMLAVPSGRGCCRFDIVEATQVGDDDSLCCSSKHALISALSPSLRFLVDAPVINNDRTCASSSILELMVSIGKDIANQCTKQQSQTIQNGNVHQGSQSLVMSSVVKGTNAVNAVRLL
jgi:hypothetical protein